MAFPATYDFNYYKGDTFEFRIYPKKNDGTVFDLSSFYVPTNFANTPDDVTDTVAPYDSAQFTIANVRGSAATLIVRGFARVFTVPLSSVFRLSVENVHKIGLRRLQ